MRLSPAPQYRSDADYFLSRGSLQPVQPMMREAACDPRRRVVPVALENWTSWLFVASWNTVTVAAPSAAADCWAMSCACFQFCYGMGTSDT